MIVVFKTEYELNKAGQVKDLPDFLAQELIKVGIAAPAEGRIADIANMRSKAQYVKKNTGTVAR